MKDLIRPWMVIVIVGGVVVAVWLLYLAGQPASIHEVTMRP